MGLLKQADSAEYRAACRLLNVFLSTKNELLQGAEGEEAEDDEDGEDGENPSASMEEEVKNNDRFFSVCVYGCFVVFIVNIHIQTDIIFFLLYTPLPNRDHQAISKPYWSSSWRP